LQQGIDGQRVRGEKRYLGLLKKLADASAKRGRVRSEKKLKIFW